MSEGTSVQEHEVLNIHEAAMLLRVSEKTIRRNLKDVPHRRLGTKLLFSRDAIIGFVRGNATKMPKVSHPKADF
jgi:hypothetical protein